MYIIHIYIYIHTYIQTSAVDVSGVWAQATPPTVAWSSSGSLQRLLGAQRSERWRSQAAQPAMFKAIGLGIYPLVI